jgi:hypothetical protein
MEFNSALPRAGSFLIVTGMLQRRSPQPEIADVVAMVHALDRDEQRTTSELAAREKRFAPALTGDLEDRAAAGLVWLDALEREDDTVRSIHHRAETALHLTSFFLVLGGILIGWGATLGAFYFDGSGRVNAVSAVALLVVIPGLFILPFVIAALPARISGRIPGFRLITTLTGAFSPGRLAPLVWRIFPRELRESMTLLSGRLGKHHRLYADLQKWAVLRWSQLFAVSFQVTAIVASLVLVVFTDLAFGWSTTLTTGDPEIDARRVHHVTSTMAKPWSWAIDDAVPSLSLIQESRYFRVAAGSVSSTQAARLGGWWKFVVLTIVVYGLLPRLITLAVARAQLRKVAHAAFVGAPGLSAVVRRIHRAQIDSSAVEPEGAGTSVRLTGSDLAMAELTPGTILAVINYAGVPVENSVFTALLPAARIFQVGGTAAMADDLNVVNQVAESVKSSDDAGVLVAVKAWEPPLMEFIDFLTLLRSKLPAKSSSIVVFPIGLDGDVVDLPAPTEAQYKLWRDKLASMGDPWLRVAANKQEVLT